MPRYVALLRAINVGGHVVKMDRLRALFSGLGFSGVETFIASGNVIFSSPEPDAAALERQVETALAEALGYPVDTFIRTPEELAAIVAHRPFGVEPAAGAGTIYVTFVARPLNAAARKQIAGLATPSDQLGCKGREVYWCRHGNLLDSTVSGTEMGKALGGPATMRNRNTIVRLVARLENEAGTAAPKRTRKEKA
jgi:uncharacterized protein (DUF1697 family)